MPRPATSSKIKKFIDETITSQFGNWLALLTDGDLRTFESELFDSVMATYNFVCEALLPIASCHAADELVEQGKASGGRKIELRRLSLRIATGHQVEVESPYVKQPGKSWKGSRHLLVDHWNIIGGTSPGLYDKVGFCSALGPSYDIAQQTLMKFGVEICLSSVRDLTNRLADHCYEQGEENLMLATGESLAGKRVVISVDGGRTRTRSYDGQVNQAGHLTYQTEWCEPKLFVIDVLDEKGVPDRYELPVYGCRFSDEEVLKLLERYLLRLEIHKAEQVQILADGAPWIWNNIKNLLLSLNVEAHRITECLDHYHALQYVHALVDQMPKRIGQKQRSRYLEDFKNWLWQGAAEHIVEECKGIYKRPAKVIRRWINYLDKHQDKMQYADYEERKLMCGSGIIESGIRRIINLRFKNASTFWDKATVEKLYFLRAALLSKRWNLVMSNLTE